MRLHNFETSQHVIYFLKSFWFYQFYFGVISYYNLNNFILFNFKTIGGNCQHMNNLLESQCCREIDKTSKHCELIKCFTEYVDFEAALIFSNKTTLQIAYKMYKQYAPKHHQK